MNQDSNASRPKTRPRAAKTFTFMFVGLTLALAACATPSSGCGEASMPQTFVLVHGAFADAHAFDAVKPLLEARGHRVIAADLPGHGADTTPLKEISLERYVEAVTRLVEAQPSQVVLVGHSMAGMVVSQVAERAPGRVQQVVFVAAYLPKNGQSLAELAKGDPESLVGQSMQFAVDSSTVTIKKDRLAEVLAADLSTEVQGFIIAGHKAEPLAPFQGKATLTDAGFGAIRRSYVFTSNDRAVTPALQQQMVAAWPNTRSKTLATAHLPFLAQPTAFVAALLELTAR